MEHRAYNARTPGSLNGKGPKSHGKGRVCACGTKIMEYRKGTKCGLCERDPERAARVLAQKQQEEEAMFGNNKWKSKDYPDGCVDCPEGEKFLRRHTGKGYCSLHYQRRKKAGTLDDIGTAAREVAESERENLGELADRIAAGHVNGDTVPPLPGEYVDPQPAGVDRAALEQGDPRLDGRLERETVRVSQGMQELDITVDQHEPRHEHTADCITPTGPNSGLLNCSVPKCDGEGECPNPNGTCCRSTVKHPDGCPRDAHETCCFNPDLCNPERHDEGQPEPSDEQEPYDEALMRHHSEALAEHFEIVEKIEQTLGVYNELIGLAARTSRLVSRTARELERIGIGVQLAPGLLPTGYEPHSEVAAMESLRVSLHGLDRDAQVRALKWVTAFYAIDRPAPSDAAATIPGK